MIRRHLNTLSFWRRLVILLLPLFAFAIGAYVRFSSGLIPVVNPVDDSSIYFGLLLFTTVVWAGVVDHWSLDRFDPLNASKNPVGNSLRACGLTYVAVTAATFFYRSITFSRLFVACSGVALYVLVRLEEWGFRKYIERAHRRSKNLARILVIGADDFAQRTADAVLERLGIPSTVAAFVSLPGQQVSVHGQRLIAFESLRAFITNTADEWIDDVVIALPPARLGEIPAIMKVLEPLCLPVRAVLDLGSGVTVREVVFDLGGLRMLDLRATPSESVVYLVAKRAIDLALSGTALVLCSPLLAAVAGAIRLTSSGPVFFVQERVGLNGRVFRMYKFRTMRMGEPGEAATRWTVAEDPRRTRLGALLRRTNIDELPQFLNVLKGDMSIVGPRPERPFFVQKFLEDVAQYNSRHYLKVGITGWAQVNGWRGDTSIPRRVEHDLYYLQHWSLAFDLKIIFLTIWRSLVANRNAY